MVEQKKQDFEKVIEHLKEELMKLRTGRANPLMIEDIKVEYFGAPTPIKQLASITVPEARQLLISPWDKSAAAQIDKAIRDSGMGFNPVNEGDKIRLNIPPLNEERRRELTKLVGKIVEEARVRIRVPREEVLKDIKKQFDDGKIREDERFRHQEKLQEMIDEYNKIIKDLSEAKEKEIMTV